MPTDWYGEDGYGFDPSFLSDERLDLESIEEWLEAGIAAGEIKAMYIAEMHAGWQLEYHRYCRLPWDGNGSA
jgi:hypothetical protein